MENWTSLYFSGFRSYPFPTLYEENKTSVSVDVLEAGWIAAFIALALSIYVIIPGQPKQLLVLIRVTLALLTGLAIMMCNFGQRWEVGMLTDTPTPYRAGSATEINADIGVKLGLRSVNITLKAAHPPTHDLVGEKIDYNERFSWTWAQGRAGFGPTAGRIQREFRAHQVRGTPLPILWIAEYFTFDGEGIRFGRHYRYAGWYAHICIWAALPAYILTVVLFKMVVSYGAMMLGLTGACLTTAAILWASIRNPIELAIPFDPPKGVLTTQFGFHWYLSLILGVSCMVAGLVIYVLDFHYHTKLCELLGINPTAYLEVDIEETKPGMDNPNTLQIRDPAANADDIEMPSVGLQPQYQRMAPSLSFRYKGRGTSQWKTHQIPSQQHLEGPSLGLPRPPPPGTAPPHPMNAHRHPHEHRRHPSPAHAPQAPNTQVTHHTDTVQGRYGNLSPLDYDLGGHQQHPRVDEDLYGDVAPLDYDLGSHQQHPGVDEDLYGDVAPPGQQVHEGQQPFYANIDPQPAPPNTWQHR